MLNRRISISPACAGLATLLLACLSLSLPAQAPDPALDARVRTVHAAARPLDAHADVLLPTTPEIYRTADGASQVSVDRLIEGGVATIVLAIQAANGPDTPEAIAAARRELDTKLARIRELAASHPDRVALAFSSADIERIHAEGKIALLIGFQNAYALGTEVSLVDRYIDEGVRVFAFNHAGNNAFSDSSRPAVPGDAPHGGLSALGKAAVRTLNDRGVLIDVSQLTPSALMEAVELSRAPVIASHSAVRALVEETRNLLDEELDAIAAKGGVVHVPPFNTYVAPRPPELVARLGEIRAGFGLPREFRGVLDDSHLLAGSARGEYTAAALAAVPRATIEDYVNHIDYVVRRIGINHVGVGTDFDHGAGIIGFTDASEAPNLTRALLARGYSEEDIAKIWSGNFMRALRAAETAAAR